MKSLKFATMLALVVLPASVSWAAQAPTLLNYQGILSQGANPLSGMQDMVFRFFATETGGAALLSDSHTNASGGQVYVASGTFHVLLGGGVVADGPAPGTYSTLQDVFANHSDVYLETEVNAEVLSPRVRIASVAFSLNARTLDGYGSSAFVPSTTNAGIGAKAVRQGATVFHENASTVRIKPGILGFPDGKVRESTSDLLWSFANGTGLLGLDTGSETASTWYYLYGVPDGADDNRFTVVASVQAPVPAGGAGPTGYPVSRFIGSFRNDGASSIPRFIRTGSMVHWGGVVGLWRNATGAENPLNTWVAVDASAFQPLTSRAVLSNNYHDCWDQNAVGYSVAPGPPQGVVAYFTLCTDWEGGTCQNEMWIPTIDRVFSWRAWIHAGWNNGTGQARYFGYVAYAEDLTEF